MKNIKTICVLTLASFLVACSPSSETNENGTTENSRVETNVENPNGSESTDPDKADPTQTQVSFYGVGDNLIHSQIFMDAHIEGERFDFSPIYQEVAPDIQEADISYINQETLLGGDEFGFSGYPNFNTPSDMRFGLIETGFDIVNGANNHTMDMGVSGVENTLHYWNEVEDQIQFTGIFESQADRDSFLTFEKNGIDFSFLTYTYGTNGIPLDQPYRTNLIDEALIRQDVAIAQSQSDVVIVAMHWGDENTLVLNDQQLYYSQLLADLEVDVVVGSHPHNLQAIEWVEGESGNQTLVAYSLGNFIATPNCDFNGIGGALEFDFIKEEDQISIENVYVQPIVVSYDSRPDPSENYRLFNLEAYPEELIPYHGHQTSKARYYEILDSAIADEFLKPEHLQAIEYYSNE